MSEYNIISYYNESFGIDSAADVNVAAALATLDNDEHLAPESSEFFDELTHDHAASHRPLVIN